MYNFLNRLFAVPFFPLRHFPTISAFLSIFLLVLTSFPSPTSTQTQTISSLQNTLPLSSLLSFPLLSSLSNFLSSFVRPSITLPPLFFPPSSFFSLLLTLSPSSSPFHLLLLSFLSRHRPAHPLSLRSSSPSLSPPLPSLPPPSLHRIDSWELIDERDKLGRDYDWGGGRGGKGGEDEREREGKGIGRVGGS